MVKAALKISHLVTARSSVSVASGFEKAGGHRKTTEEMPFGPSEAKENRGELN
jgi:hypothetical protein